MAHTTGITKKLSLGLKLDIVPRGTIIRLKLILTGKSDFFENTVIE
jgi:hypothetical protein